MDVPIMFCMEASPDILRLRESRIAVLKRLIAFAVSLLGGLRAKAAEGRSVLFPKLDRIRRWLAVAIFLARRIGEGALDAPRPPRPARQRPAVEREALERDETELFWFDAPRQSERRLERYLDMPFGEAVGRICKGLGIKPDWTAWSAEPWAQEETRTRPPGSPYAGEPSAPGASPIGAAARRPLHPPPDGGRSPSPALRAGQEKQGADPSVLSPAPPEEAGEGDRGAPAPGWRGRLAPPPNRKARRAQAAKARHRATQTRSPFAHAAG
ncbi:MAG TPA: hypothetical protein VFE03_07915 [Caulobacteraceae bacterium]|nr:hypothetical protein [Caulobacteraceae bacterium]